MADLANGSPSLITLYFPGERADPAAAEVLAGLAAGSDISLLDVAFVVRSGDGPVRITGGRESLDSTGLDPLGTVKTGARAEISEHDLSVIGNSLQPGTSAAVIAYEDSWVVRLSRTVEQAGGTVVISQAAERWQAWASYRERQAVAESDAAVRQAEAEVAAAERAAGEFATPASERPGGSLVNQLADLARLRESGALSAAEFEAAKARLLAA